MQTSHFQGLAFGILVATASLTFSLLAIADVPRPEHPRPDALRDNWLSLNGEWQFEIDAKDDGEARGLIAGKNLPLKIEVPFCPESKLSGLAHTEYMNRVWYRRTVEIPESMKGKRVLLHFGAVDYKTWVYVNGHLVGTHLGGSAAFGFDITEFLKPASNEIVVQVHDDLRSGLQPGGKQAYGKSAGCMYTRTTGIWQTVWLEAVGSSYVENLSVVADPEHSRVLVEAAVNGSDPDLNLKIEAFAEGDGVGSDSSTGAWRNHRLVLNLSKKKLWEPGSPFLYDLKCTLTSAGKTVDEMKSYFGLRSVSIEGRRVLINGKPVFQRTILDQGFYPEGIWTAPSDAALKHDIEMSMAAGFNGARLHQKVFEPRYLYWADKLGYMVWGEFPNWGFNWKPQGYAPWIAEWTEVLLQNRNHPAIIGWCPSNESPEGAGELQSLVWNVTRAVDPTRPALETSGWSHTLPSPEVLDAHDYDGNPENFRKHWTCFFNNPQNSPATPARYGGEGRPVRDRGIPFMVSEFGGIGWGIEGGWGYGQGPKSMEEFYTRYTGLCAALLDNPNLFGFCYTQLTDVEQEHNGLYYYDRKPKFDLKRLHDATARQAACERGESTVPRPAAIGQPVQWKVLVGAVQDGSLCTPYHYTTQAPGPDWNSEKFDDHAWRTGAAPFGRDEHRATRTPWTSSDIYLRKTFESNGSEIGNAELVISYDEDTEVYVNGQKILAVKGFISDYRPFIVTDKLKKALKKGSNTLAVHTHQTVGGQFIDMALLCQ